MADSFQVQLLVDKLRELSASDLFANLWEATKSRFLKNSFWVPVLFLACCIHFSVHISPCYYEL